MESEPKIYPGRANRIRIQHRHGRVVAMIEIVSPGHKSSANALPAFVEKASDFLSEDIHLLIVDLFPPSPRDPQGIHGAIWSEVDGGSYSSPPDKPLTAVAYQARPVLAAYVEPLAVGDELPSLPIFLTDYDYVPAPLEDTYRASWAAFPRELKVLLEEPPTGE
jgi:hypothetical protein